MLTTWANEVGSEAYREHLPTMPAYAMRISFLPLMGYECSGISILTALAAAVFKEALGGRGLYNLHRWVLGWLRPIDVQVVDLHEAASSSLIDLSFLAMRHGADGNTTLRGSATTGGCLSPPLTLSRAGFIG